MIAGRNATIYDVAREAGVSIATVSRVLDGKGTVAPATVKKVQAAIEKCNYFPSALARNFTRKTTHMLAMVLPELTNPYYAQIFSAAHARATQAGYVLVLYPQPQNKIMDQPLCELLMAHRFDGVVLTGDYITCEELQAQTELVQRLTAFMPVVMLGCVPPEYEHSAILTDLYRCAALAVEALHGMGHQRIAFVGAVEGIRLRNSRERGYQETMEQCGLSAHIRIVPCQATAEDGERAVSRWLAELSPEELPTAIMAINDQVALGAMKALAQRGLRVPEDVSVIGCDDQFFARFTQPTLSSLDTQAQWVGSHAIEMLLAGETRQQQMVPPRLVMRDSCCPPRED